MLRSREVNFPRICGLSPFNARFAINLDNFRLDRLGIAAGVSFAALSWRMTFARWRVILPGECALGGKSFPGNFISSRVQRFLRFVDAIGVWIQEPNPTENLFRRFPIP